MRSFTKALGLASALTFGSTALAQTTTTTSLASLLTGGGIIGLAVGALVLWFLFRFFFNND